MSITVTVADVAALVPEATIPEERATGQKAVIESEVEDWIASLTAALVSGLHEDWLLLPEDKVELIEAAGKTIVACAAASYVEAARAPERAGLANTTYSAVLWDRWMQGRAELTAQVEEWLAESPTLSHVRPGYSFPDARVTDSLRW